MGNGLYPLIPVLIHQVGDDASRGLRQVGVNILRALAEGNLLDVCHLLLIGGEEVVGETTLDVGHLTAIRPIGSHRPDLRCTALRRDIADTTSLLHPACSVHTCYTLRDLTACAPITADGEELGANLILLNIREAYAIDDRLAIWGEGRATDTG